MQLNGNCSQVGSDLQDVFERLSDPQIVEAESVFDDVVREEHLSAFSIFDEAVAFIVVVRNKSCTRQVSLLRQVNQRFELTDGHG